MHDEEEEAEMNSTALIVIIFLVIAAIVSTAVGRWRENHTDDAAAWGRLPNQARQDQVWESPSDSARRSRKRASGHFPDESRRRDQTKQESRKSRSGKSQKGYYPPKDTRSFDTGSAPAGRQIAFGKIILIVILIIVAAVAIPPITRSITNGSSGKKSSHRPKTEDSQAALSSLESQMRDLFPSAETDSDYADTLGYIVRGYISDNDDYYRPYVEISVSEEGVITTVVYRYVFPVIDNMEDKEQAVSDMEDVLQSMYDKVSQIQGNLASDHLKDYPDISENVRNGLLTVKSDSAEDSIQDSFTYDDGCQMQCEEFGGRSLYLEFWKYN